LLTKMWSCFKNSKMAVDTTRPLEVKLLGLELPTQRKSTSGKEMIKEQFMETGYDRINLICIKPEFFEDQKPFLHPQFVEAFQELLDSKTVMERE